MPMTNDDVAASTVSTEAEMRPQRVPVNMYEAREAMVLVAPLPAVRGEDVRIELRPGDPATLRFWAHLRSAGPREYVVHEWEYGGYERQLELPAGFGGGVEASLRNGQLAVRVLRGECTQPLTLTPS
jgi:HSP20 family molecular chaperone IbpA